MGGWLCQRSLCRGMTLCVGPCCPFHPRGHSSVALATHPVCGRPAQMRATHPVPTSRLRHPSAPPRPIRPASLQLRSADTNPAAPQIQIYVPPIQSRDPACGPGSDRAHPHSPRDPRAAHCHPSTPGPDRQSAAARHRECERAPGVCF